MNFRRLMRRPSAEDYSLPHSNAAAAANLAGNVSDESKADLTDREPDFRFTPESRLKADIVRCPFGARS